MKISLCTITAKRPEWFKWWYWNATKQTMKVNEIIIIDDGTWPDKCDIKKISVKTKLSTGMKRNIAVENAVNDYIVFFDDDDWYSPSTIKVLHDNICQGISGIDTIIFYSPKFNKFGIETTKLIHHPFIVKKNIAINNPWPDIMDGEDLVFYRKMPTIKKISEKLIIAIQHNSNVFNNENREIQYLPNNQAYEVLKKEKKIFYEKINETYIF
jgi:glycosyltransferase involved in cell wall biosynthesis